MINIKVTTTIRPFPGVQQQAYEILTTVENEKNKDEIYSIREIMPTELIITDVLAWIMKDQAKQIQNAIYARQQEIFERQVNDSN